MPASEAPRGSATVTLAVPIGAANQAEPAQSNLTVAALPKSLGAVPLAAELPLETAVESPAPTVLLLSVSAPPAASAPGTTLASEAPRPLDFAALVDRIEAAREAGAIGAVSVAIQHEDFGPISLRFETHAGGLTVDLRSRDPEFAQAVSGALSAQSETPRSDASARGSDQNSGRQDMNGQARSSTGSRHGEASRSAVRQPAAQRDSTDAAPNELFA